MRIGDQEIAQLQFRQVTSDELRILGNVSGNAHVLAKTIELIGSNPDDPSMVLTPEIIDKINGADAVRISRELTELLSRG